MAWQGIEAPKQTIEFPDAPSVFSSKKWIKLIPKTIGNRKRDCAWGCARRINTTSENLQIEKHKSVRWAERTPSWLVLFDLQIFWGGVYPPSATSRTISFSISNSFWYLINPLWGHCQDYKIEKKAILQGRLLSEKRSALAEYNLTLSESFCLTDHEKQVQKFVAHWKVCQKSSQREVIRKNAYKAPKPQRVLLLALLLKFSRSLRNFQASPGRQSSLRSKDRPPHHAVV